MPLAAAEQGAMPAVEPAAPSARPLRALPLAHAHQGSGGPAPKSAAAADGTWPDVTISIGHIEVRAAPAIEHPRTRPAFRPRVPLDDFLNQRQDRRR